MPGDEERGGTLSAIILAAVVVIVAIYMVAFGLGTLTWAGAKMAASRNPWVREVPNALPQPAAAPQLAEQPAAKSRKLVEQSKDVTLAAYGYEFAVPWHTKYESTEKRGGTEFRFASGQIIFFFNPENQLDALKNFSSVNSPEHDKFESIFSGHPMNTNYELYQTVYDVSPAKFSPFMNAQDAMRLNVLLNWKLSFGRDSWPGLYSFSFGGMRGLQFGDPAKGRPVAVRAFDTHDQQARMLFMVAAGSGAKLSQDEVSSVLASLRIAPLAGS